MSRRNRDFSYVLCPTHSQPPTLSAFPTRWYICYNWWTYSDTTVLSKVHCLYACSLLGFAHSIGLNKFIMAHIHHCSITLRGLLFLKENFAKNPFCLEIILKLQKNFKTMKKMNYIWYPDSFIMNILPYLIICSLSSSFSV